MKDWNLSLCSFDVSRSLFVTDVWMAREKEAKLSWMPINLLATPITAIFFFLNNKSLAFAPVGEIKRNENEHCFTHERLHVDSLTVFKQGAVMWESKHTEV